MAVDVVTWEHLVVYLEANTNEQVAFLQKRWPGKTFPMYAAQALTPKLDHFGQEGWELVSVEPVIVGQNGDILVSDRRDAWTGRWTFTYLCVFKRPKAQEA